MAFSPDAFLAFALRLVTDPLQLAPERFTLPGRDFPFTFLSAKFSLLCVTGGTLDLILSFGSVSLAPRSLAAFVKRPFTKFPVFVKYVPAGASFVSSIIQRGTTTPGPSADFVYDSGPQNLPNANGRQVTTPSVITSLSSAGTIRFLLYLWNQTINLYGGARTNQAYIIKIG